MVEFGLFLGFHPAKTWPLVQSSDTRNTYFRILSSLHHSWSSLPFKMSNETGLLSVWNIFICTWFYYILYNSLFLAITAFDVIEALALSLSASLQLLLQGLDVVDGVEDHLKLGHPAGGLLLPVVGRPALWQHWAKPLQLVGGEILGGADVLHHLLHHCHLWLSLGFSGFQKKLCRDVYSSKDEQQVASEARPRSLYSTGKEGRRSKWEPWAPGDVWSSGVEKGAGRRVLWIITRPITSTIPPFSAGVRVIMWSARIQWSAGEEVENYFARNILERAVLLSRRSCTMDNGRNTQEVPTHCCLLSKFHGSVFTDFQLPFNCRFSDDPVCHFQLLSNCDQIQSQNFNGSSQFSIWFTTQSHCS